MSQHDMNIANQGFPAFRADLNDALGALVSNSSGATAPSTTFAHQFWVDTAADPSVLKIRNADNDAWITIGEIDQTGDKFNLTCANATISENLTLNAQGDLRFADSDSSNWVAFQAPATVASNVTWTLPATDGTSGQALTTDGSGVLSWAAGSPENGYNFRNRIINGDMRIDQRNAGASVTPSTSTSQYLVDRWKIDYSQTSKITAQQSTTAPVGFTTSLQLTVATAVTAGASDYFLLAQPIEGFNTADLGFGSASAKTITISFQVRSSVTGTYAVTVRNSAANRTYIGTYTINSADTFESKSVTLVGDTSGTWVTNNGIGLNVLFDLGSGSDFNGTAGSWAGVNDFRTSSTTNWIANSGATFYITGVQLEVGSVATPFERRPYGTELSLCQRYYYRTADENALTNLISVAVETSTNAAGGFPHPVSMRAAPSITLGGGIGFFSAASGIRTPTVASNRSNTTTFAADFTIAGATAGQAGTIYRQTTNGFLEANSEL